MIVGAIRLAKPTSKWARRYYGEDKMRAAVLRFPKPQQHSSEQIPQTSPIPKGHEGTLGVARPLDEYDGKRAPTALPPPVPATSRPAVGVSLLENELRSLAALKADGIISEEEFTAKKRALLGL